jgi:hypothetical protein
MDRAWDPKSISDEFYIPASFDWFFDESRRLWFPMASAWLKPITDQPLNVFFYFSPLIGLAFPDSSDLISIFLWLFLSYFY